MKYNGKTKASNGWNRGLPPPHPTLARKSDGKQDSNP
jgi:hypothetical protein